MARKRLGTLVLGHYRIPVFLRDGLMVLDDSATHVIGEGSNGSFGTFQTVGGCVINLSKESPDLVATLLHEFLHAVLFIRGHPDTLDEEWLCDCISDAVAEFYSRNGKLIEAVRDA